LFIDSNTSHFYRRF